MYEVLKLHAPIYEISNETTVTGRRHIKVVLHEIHPDSSHYQENGISWDERYVTDNLKSAIGMSIVAEFLTDDRDIPYGHGMTDIREDNMPLFEDATMVGHFDRVYIDNMEIDGVERRVLVAEGTLDEMRYPKFVAWLKENMEDGTVKGSVEIVGKPEHEGHIIYSGGWKEHGRVPQIYDYSGYAILSIKPADEAAVVMELNNKKTGISEEETNMDEKLKNELITAISGALSETNSKWDEYWAKVQAKEAEITQLQADIKAKEAEIAQLRADLEAEQAARALAENGLTEANAKVEAAEKELTEANAKIGDMADNQARAELNAALAGYTDEQKEVAKAEIEAFNEKPGSVEINTIVGKICTEIVRTSREAQVSEQNSADQIDVFGAVEDPKHEESDEDVDVF